MISKNENEFEVKTLVHKIIFREFEYKNEDYNKDKDKNKNSISLF